MATLLALKRRITAAQNVSKTTRAMQMISASKLKKAQDAAYASRPYVQKLREITLELNQQTEHKLHHPYLQADLRKPKLLIIVSPDKGLCGSLPSSLLKEFLTYQKNTENLSFIVIGKKMEANVIKSSKDIVASFAFGTTLPAFETVFPLIKLIDEYYLSGKVGSVQILYAHFESFFNQKPKLNTLLPIELPENGNTNSFSLYEPSIESILPYLLKHYLEMSIYQSLLESYLSEQAARMLAMQTATTNANEIIDDLKLEYNKTRQAKITSELLDITGGRR